MPVRPLIHFESPTTESLLRQNGLGTLDAIFMRRSAAQLRHVGRAVSKVELRDSDGQTVTVYVKLSWGRRRWWPRMADLRTGQVFKSLAVREWEGLAVFERLGLHVPQRLAILEEGLLWKRSALIVKAVPPAASLSDMILNGSWLQVSRTDRALILEEIARTIGLIHDSGWAWRSISTRHIFPQQNARGGWELWLIDCEGVHRAGSPGLLSRDFRRFLRALSHDQADAETVEMMRTIGDRLSASRPWGSVKPRPEADRSAA
jgi:Lipopolysaccharide kinase (Kdo/WaaP) family